MREGLGRPIPDSDVRADIQEQWLDAEAEQDDRRRQFIVERVHEVDAWQKRLTGRRAEQYARESGVALEELFPSGKEVLNVGDPWQTLDLPGVTSIDYQFGEEAEFVRDPDTFLHLLPSRLDSIGMEGHESMPIELKEAIATAVSASRNATIDDYPAVAAMWKAAKEMHGLLRPAEDAEWLSRDLWYDLHRLERGFLDLHLMRTVIEPTLETKTVREKLSLEEQETLINELIEKHRFIKKTTFAKVIKATFPDVPFEDDSFDRLTASWSLSTHMFPEMTKEQFDLYWETMSRILKKGGNAYLWPIYQGNEWALWSSLQDFVAAGGKVEVIKAFEKGELRRVHLKELRRDEDLLDIQTLIIHAKK